MQRIERSVFGELNGKPIHLFRLSNANGMVAELLEFGGRIKALCIPDGQGGLDNMSVGYDTFEPYHARFNPWLGALLGRTASRVTGARFQIDGKTYNLSASGPAGSNMHGGFVGFDSRVWTGEADSDATGATLKLTYLSPDGEEGYPGNASVTVTYRLDDDNRFHMNWEAVTDAPTIIDMSSHVYLNLNGFKNRDVMNEYLKVNASYYLEKDATGTPTGNFIPVEGTVFDLRTPKLMEELSQGAVYNPIMALDGEGGTLREVAEVSIPEQGRSYPCTPRPAPCRCTTPITWPRSILPAGWNPPSPRPPALPSNRRTTPTPSTSPPCRRPFSAPAKRTASGSSLPSNGKQLA